MRNRKRWIKSAALMVASLLFGVVTMVSAQGPQGRPGRLPPGGPGGPGGVPPGLMQINLTDQQRADLRTLVEQDRESRKTALEQLRTVRQQLTVAVFGSPADMQQVSDLTAQLADLQRQGLEADIALQLKIAALLTDEQRQQIVTARPPRQH